MEQQLELPLGTLPSPAELIRLPSNEIRSILNVEASRILQKTTEQSIAEYEEFASRYEEAIQRAWFIPKHVEGTEVLGYRLMSKVAEGGFGTVYRAVDMSDDDGTQFAVKILHERIRDNHDKLQSFRRGVRSMRILTKEKVRGVVPFRDASEIPAMVAMEFIEGLNLVEAVARGVLRTWRDLLHVAIELTKIIRSSHRLTQRVLHRDIRPANVMLKNCWAPNPDWRDVEVIVLDFDLSWHLDAFDVSINQGTVSGYLAPEQVDRQHGKTTRSAAVDSFGLGMTFYYLLTGVDPQVMQHRHGDWVKTLEGCASNKPCENWRSLPGRFVRLIENCTKDDQNRRWEMAYVLGELEQLGDAEQNPNSVRSVELLTEEIASRAFTGGFEWDDEHGTARYSFGGFKLSLKADVRQSLVSLDLDWSRIGGEGHQSVKKWLPVERDRVLALLRGSGWEASCTINTGHLSCAATISSAEASRYVKEIAKAIQQLIESMKVPS